MARRKKQLKSTFWFEYFVVSFMALAIGFALAMPVKQHKVSSPNISQNLKDVGWILETKSLNYIVQTKMDDDARNPGRDKEY
jgi:hypothetical protein